jgi:nucleotide-binding universal stress UspA family protein
MYDTIVVPTDGSECAQRAAEHAREVALAFDAAVHVVSVVDEAGASSVFERSGVDEERRAALREDARSAVSAAESVLGEGVEVSSSLLDGHPTEAILGFVADVDANLLVMGTHGRTGVDRYVAGSVTERVLRRADVPVLAVHADDDPTALSAYENVLVPTDGSDAAAAAFEHALLVAAVGDAAVHALNVVDVAALTSGPGASPPTTLLEEFEAAGQTAVEDVAADAREAGIDAQTAVVRGSPGDAVLEYADDHHVDVIVMGTTGRTGIDRYLLGSTTERVLRHARVPVLAVNARDGDDGDDGDDA